MSYFDEWLDDCFSHLDQAKIRSIGCWSYGSSKKKGPQQLREELEDIGVGERTIRAFLDGVFGHDEPPEYCI